MGNYLITGAAGFIGARTSEMLVNDGHTVVGVDNMNTAYDLRMKEYRLKRLQALSGFDFHKLDISDKTIVEHFKGEKTVNFTYSPKKRIRQKTGHRQSYTRLAIETIEK